MVLYFLFIGKLDIMTLICNELLLSRISTGKIPILRNNIILENKKIFRNNDLRT